MLSLFILPPSFGWNSFYSSVSVTFIREMQGSNVTGSSAIKDLFRLPKTIKEIEEHAKKVLKGLPSTAIVMMSLIEENYTEFLSCKGVKAWILVSRLSFKMKPVEVLLPVYSVLQDKANTLKNGGSLVDRLIPDFRTLVQDYYLGGDCSVIAMNSYYKKDEQLKTMLRNLEESWFSSGKFLLQGELVDNDTKREPIILVLDDEMLMLPLESMPILRKEEVYRMPSVSSIYIALDKMSNYYVPQKNYKRRKDNSYKEEVERNLMKFPSIDPLDTFYLINPSGDLTDVQTSFQKFLKSKEFELKGKTGSAPTLKELADSLEAHDLFLYIGHDNGEQYISSRNIVSLKKCAAAILIGCSSGKVTPKGSYGPTGVPLSYLLAGSPFIVGALWGVLSKEMKEFTIAMCDEMWKRSKLLEDTIGALVSQARESCSLSYLIGASIICYGVPTIISKCEDNLEDLEGTSAMMTS